MVVRNYFYYSLKFPNFALMKMTLKDRIARSQEVLNDDEFAKRMHSNDRLVVYYASKMFGSQLSECYNDILMNRNAVPKRWRSDPRLSDCIKNSAFKKAYSQVVEYLEQCYDITPGRVHKLLNLLSWEDQRYSRFRMYLTDKTSLKAYLRNLNNLRIHSAEMTDSEIYDFSFDMVYDFIDMLSLSNETLSLSLLIMYWIQRESDLIPLAVKCSKEEFAAALESCYETTSPKKESKREFRLFMRKLLDDHLKLFIRNEYDKSKAKPTSRDRILKLIKENPTHTAKTMASCLGLSVQAVQKQIVNLKKENRLRRIGPDNGGRWEEVP